MKILIIGKSRHGKDKAAEVLRDNFKLTFSSSSEFCLNEFIYDMLKDHMQYSSKEECYADRVNHRDLWYELIRMYNTTDRARLAKGIVSKFDIYVGMRDLEEYIASRHLFHHVIFIDATDRLGESDVASDYMTKDLATVVIPNNGTEEEFERNIVAWYCTMIDKYHQCGVYEVR